MCGCILVHLRVIHSGLITSENQGLTFSNQSPAAQRLAILARLVLFTSGAAYLAVSKLSWKYEQLVLI
jgi:hypothetical protein